MESNLDLENEGAGSIGEIMQYALGLINSSKLMYNQEKGRVGKTNSPNTLSIMEYFAIHEILRALFLKRILSMSK